MTIANNPARAAFLDISKEVKAGDNRLAKLVAPLVKLDVKPDDMKGGGKYHDDLKDGVARAYLTPAEYKIFADTSLATSAKGEPTQRGKLQRKVSPNVDKVRKRIIEALALPKVKRGASERKTFDQVMAAQIDKWVARITKDKDKDSFKLEADPIAVKAALVAVVKILR